MKQVKRVFALFLIMALLFTGIDWITCSGVKAYADNVPTQGSTELGETPEELLAMGEWLYYVEDGQATVAGYQDKTVTSLQIPAHLGGFPVTGIGREAFCENTALSSIQIPTNVTRIAQDAFEGLKALTIEAYHGAYALVYAANKGFGTVNLSKECVFVAGVIDLSGAPKSSYSGLSSDGVVFKAGEASFLAVGQILSFPASPGYPTGLAKRVDTITETDGQLVVTFSQPEWGECFERVFGEDELIFDWDHAIVYDGFERLESEDTEASKTVYGGELKQWFGVDVPLGSGFSLKGGVSLSFGTTTVSYDVGLKGALPNLKSASIDIPVTATFNVALGSKHNFDVNGRNGRLVNRKTITTVPVASIGGVINGYVTLDWIAEVKGSLDISISVVSSFHFDYNNGKISKSFTKHATPTKIEISAEFTTGPDLSIYFVLGWKDFSIRFFEFSAGVHLVIKGTTTFRSIVSGTTNTLICIQADIKIEIPVSVKIGIIKVLSFGGVYASLSFTAASFSIYSGHWDNMEKVAACSFSARPYYFVVDGVRSSTMYADINQPLQKRSDPYKSGYTFGGWYVDTAASGLPGGDYKFDLSRDVMPYCGLNGTLKIYAKFIPIPVKSVTLDKESETIYTNNKNGVQLYADVQPKNAADTSVSWSSSNTNVATVNSNGKVMPVAAGTATITCRSKFNSNIYDTFTITVKQYVERVDLVADTDEIFEGETLQLTANIYPGDSSDKRLSWSSSNPGVASVDQNGKISGVRTGTAVITATAKDRNTIFGTFAINILLPVTGIELDRSTAVIYTNNKTGLQLNPSLTPPEAILASVKWESSNTGVAKVSSTGVVTPVLPGTATITCRSKSDPNVTDICVVTVKQYVETITLGSSLASIVVDDTLQLSSSVGPSNATDKSLQWTSSNNSVATVDQNGVVTGVGAGSVIITATARDGSGVYDSVKLVVVAMPSEPPEVEVTGVVLDCGDHKTVYTVHKTAQINATVLPPEADQSVIWASSNEGVATIDNTGKITMIKGGTTLLTCRSASDPHQYANCVLRVVQSVEEISFSGETHIEVGQSTVLTPTVKPDNAEDKSVSWSCVDQVGTNVATVTQSGKVTGVSNGVTKVTATAKDGSGVSNYVYVRVGHDPIPVESITLDITELSRYTNEKDGVVLTPTVLPVYADDLSVIWSSSDEQVATVDSSGRVRFTAPGTTTITCRSVMTPDVTATCAVTVKQYVEQIVLDVDKTILLPGETAQLSATVYPNNASDKTLTWSSEDSSIATVDANGKVTAVGYGTTAIKAVAADGSGAETLQTFVVEKELQLDVSVVNDTVFTQGNESCDIAYVGLTAASVQRMAEAGYTLNWSFEKKSGSGDTEMTVLPTTLTRNGQTFISSVAALRGREFPTAGTELYTVTCQAGPYEESADVTVTVDGTAYASAVNITNKAVGANTIAAQIGECITISGTPYSADGGAVPQGMRVVSNGDGYYLAHAAESRAGNDLLVSFDESGVYTAVFHYSKGNLAYDVTGTFNIADENGIVHLRVESLTLDHAILKLVEGKQQRLHASVLPEDAYDSSVTWKSENKKVATVSSSGLVKAIAPGTTVITCTAKDGTGLTAMCTVTVESYLQLDETELSYKVYTGGNEHADLDIVNVTLDSQERLVEDGLNVTWNLERLSGDSTELGLSEYTSVREDGLSVSGNQLKLLRINGAGTDEYRLTCSAGDYSDFCLIHVISESAELPQAVTLTKNSYAVSVDEWMLLDTRYTTSPSAAALPEDVTVSIDGGRSFLDALSWQYNFSEPEKMLFEKAGSFTAYVSFSGDNYSYRCPVAIDVANEDGIVPPSITDVVIDDSEDTLLMMTGDTKSLSVTVTPSNASYSTVNWSSTNTAVATVSSSGQLTAIGPGYATIVASIPEADYEGTCLVCVEEGINFRMDDLERTVFVDGETRMALETVMLTDNTSSRLSSAPTWTLRRVSGISLTLRAEPIETTNAQGITLYGCNLILYSVSKDGDTVYELECSDGTDSRTLTIVVHAVHRDRVLPASISLDQTEFTADVGELIVFRPSVTVYPEGTRLPSGILVTCEGDTQFLGALNPADTHFSQSINTISFNTPGTYETRLVFSYSNIKYIVPVTFRVRDENGFVPVQTSRMTVSRQMLYMVAGDTEKLEAVFTPANATNQAVTWSSSNPSVASIDSNGTVTALKNGTAAITCDPADETLPSVTCSVVVEDYLTIQTGTTSSTLYLQGRQDNAVGYARLSEGSIRRLKTDGITPVWTVDTAGATHAVIKGYTETDKNSVSFETEQLLSGGADTYTVTCVAGSYSWSKTFTLNVSDLGSTLPKSVTIASTEIAAAVNETVTVDFSPILSPAGSSLPSGMTASPIVGVGEFYDAYDDSVFNVDGNLVTVAFTRPGRYLMLRRYLLKNLQYVTACTVTVGGAQSTNILSASETSFTVYSGGQSGVASTVSITDSVVLQMWGDEIRWSAERISGDSLTVAMKKNETGVDVFVANVLHNGTDVWRISSSFGNVTESVDITLTAADPRGLLPESIELGCDVYSGMIGDWISVPLGVVCQPSGSVLPDKGDDFWSFRFDQAGEERSTHTIENGLLRVNFSMSGYYTGTLRYRSGNVSYAVPVYFVIQDEEQEVRTPDMSLYAVNTFDTVYPEGEKGVAIGQIVLADGLSAYSTGAVIAYMKDKAAAWKLTETGTAAALSLRKVSDTVYDVVLDSTSGSGNVSYSVTCTVDGEVYAVSGNVHVAGASEGRPDASLRQTMYQATVGDTVSINRKVYSREDSSVLQSSSKLDAAAMLAAVGYEIDENTEDWSMTFYEAGSFNAVVNVQVSNLVVAVPITITVLPEGSTPTLTVLRLPAALTAIEDEAFADIAANVIDLRGSNIRTIGSGAFKNSVNVELVYLPASVTSIGEHAFYGCLNAVICCENGSYAAQWAAANGFPVVEP